MSSSAICLGQQVGGCLSIRSLSASVRSGREGYLRKVSNFSDVCVRSSQPISWLCVWQSSSPRDPTTFPSFWRSSHSIPQSYYLLLTIDLHLPSLLLLLCYLLGRAPSTWSSLRCSEITSASRPASSHAFEAISFSFAGRDLQV